MSDRIFRNVGKRLETSCPNILYRPKDVLSILKHPPYHLLSGQVFRLRFLDPSLYSTDIQPLFLGRLSKHCALNEVTGMRERCRLTRMKFLDFALCSG